MSMRAKRKSSRHSKVDSSSDTAAADVGTLSSRRYYSYSFAMALGAILWVGGIVSYAGHSLPEERSTTLYRFCGGKCLCDGGIANAEIMSRVCPEGWEEAYSVARQKLRRHHKSRQDQLRRQMQAQPPSPPPPPTGPNV